MIQQQALSGLTDLVSSLDVGLKVNGGWTLVFKGFLCSEQIWFVVFVTVLVLSKHSLS